MRALRLYLCQLLEAQGGVGLERLARYVTRPALAVGAVKLRQDGRVEVATPPDPRTGASSRVLDPLDFDALDFDALDFDALDFVRAVVTQIPDARKHLVRYYGAYSHRSRGRRRAVQTEAPAAAVEAGSGVPTPSLPGSATLLARAPAEPGSPEARRRSAWARVLKKVFEVIALRCRRGKTKMLVVAWITQPAVIDRILAYRRQAGLESPFDARGPPSTGRTGPAWPW